MAEMNIDGVTAHVVLSVPAAMNVDGTAAYAVVQRAGPNQFRRTPRVELLEALAAKTKVSLPATQYDIGPVVNEDPPSAKATIDLIALEASGKRRTTPVTYNRRGIRQLSATLDFDLMKPTTAAPITNLAQMVSSLNSIYGLTLAEYDFLPQEVVQDGPTILTTAKESHYFVPGGKLNLGRLDKTDREYEMLLKGLNWPNQTIATQQAFFVKDTFRIEFNKLLGNTYTAEQTTIPDTSLPSTGPSTNRERQIDLTFTVGGVPTTKQIYYNRLDLAEVVPQFIRTNCWDLWEGKLFDAPNLVELATMIGLPFEELELVNTDVVETTPGGTIDITIRAAANSKFFKGEATIAITRAPWITDLVPHGTAFSM